MHIYSIWNGSDAVYLVAFIFCFFFFIWAHWNITIIFSSRDHDVWLLYSYIIQCVDINDQWNISMLLLQLAVFFFIIFIWYSIRNIYWPAKRSKWHRTLDSDLSRSTYIRSLRHSNSDHTHHMFVVHCYRKSRRQNGVCLVFFSFCFASSFDLPMPMPMAIRLPLSIQTWLASNFFWIWNQS